MLQGSLQPCLNKVVCNLNKQGYDICIDKTKEHNSHLEPVVWASSILAFAEGRKASPPEKYLCPDQYLGQEHKASLATQFPETDGRLFGITQEE